MAGKKSGSNDVVLITALVVFILASIGLGVLYYLGIEETKKAVDTAATAAKKSTSDSSALLDAELKVKLYRAFVGTATQEEVASIQASTSTALKDEQVKLVAAANTKITAVSTALATDFKPEDIFTWNYPAAGQPSPSTLLERFASVIASKEKSVSETKLQSTNTQLETVKLKEAQKQAAEVSAKATADGNAKITELTNAIASIEQQKKESIENFEREVQKMLKSSSQKSQQLDELQAKYNEIDREVVGYKEKTKLLEDQITGFTEAKRGSFAVNLPHGEILSRRGKLVEINIGSSSNLKEGQTFTIQPVSTKTEGLASRRQMKYDANNNLVVSDEEKSKGSIEIVTILGTDLAEARIVDEPDSVRESILKGDLLYNPVWKKNASEHVVLAGIFDVDGDQKDDTNSVVATLTKRGIVVDAVYDLASRKWVSTNPKNTKPGPTQLTTYVIRGWMPDSTGVNDPLQAAKSELTIAINNAVSDAKTKGAQEVKATKFFSEIGYKYSQSITEQSINNAANEFLKDIAPPPPMDK